jgi:hypothetical protein
MLSIDVRVVGQSASGGRSRFRNEIDRCTVPRPLDRLVQEPTIPGMSFNRLKLEDQRREAAEKEAVGE